MKTTQQRGYTKGHHRASTQKANRKTFSKKEYSPVVLLFHPRRYFLPFFIVLMVTGSTKMRTHARWIPNYVIKVQTISAIKRSSASDREKAHVMWNCNGLIYRWRKAKSVAMRSTATAGPLKQLLNKCSCSSRNYRSRSSVIQKSSWSEAQKVWLNWCLPSAMLIPLQMSSKRHHVP